MSYPQRSWIWYYLPPVDSVYGLFFYSFIVYVVILALSLGQEYLLRESNDNPEELKKRIVQRRTKKRQEADELLRRQVLQGM